MSGFRFKDEGRDVLGELLNVQPPPPSRLLAGKFETIAELTSAYEELEQASAELDERIRVQNLNELYFGGR